VAAVARARTLVVSLPLSLLPLQPLMMMMTTTTTT
jgi:hypothetical protein